MAARKPKLGRGLDALLGSTAPIVAPVSDGDRLAALPIEHIRAGRFQPRTRFDDDRLDELAESIRVQGVIQPIVVREIEPGRFEIIAGERRWRAAKRAGLDTIPAVMRAGSDRDVLAVALIENIQREDLSPLEEAAALKRLIDDFALTHQDAATAVGRSRAAVSNLLRLLDLPGPIRTLLEDRRIEMGHARALLSLPEAAAIALAREAAAEGFSVREVERRAKLASGATKKTNPRGKPKAVRPDPDLVALERELSETIGTPVRLEARGRGGRLVIEYFDSDQLEGVLRLLRNPRRR